MGSACAHLFLVNLKLKNLILEDLNLLFAFFLTDAYEMLLLIDLLQLVGS